MSGLSRLKEIALYYSMQMSADKRNNNSNEQEANGPIATGRSSGYIPGSRKKIIYYNNMEEKNKLIRELLSENTIEDLQTLINFERQMKKPKSTVKRMVDYFMQIPIPLAPQANTAEVRRAMKGYATAFKINTVNERDPLSSCKK